MQAAIGTFIPSSVAQAGSMAARGGGSMAQTAGAAPGTPAPGGGTAFAGLIHTASTASVQGMLAAQLAGTDATLDAAAAMMPQGQLAALIRQTLAENPSLLPEGVTLEDVDAALFADLSGAIPLTPDTLPSHTPGTAQAQAVNRVADAMAGLEKLGINPDALRDGLIAQVSEHQTRKLQTTLQYASSSRAQISAQTAQAVENGAQGGTFQPLAANQAQHAASLSAAGNNGSDALQTGADGDDALQAHAANLFRMGQGGQVTTSPMHTAVQEITDAGRSGVQSHTPRSAFLQQVPVSEQVQVRVTHALQHHQNQVHIQLQPAELGRVDVRMEIIDGGRIQVNFMADQADTLAALQRDTRGLERALNEAGFKSDAANLQFSLRDEQQEEGQSAFAQNEQQGKKGGNGGQDAELPWLEDALWTLPGAENAPSVAALHPYGAPLAYAGEGLDIQV